MIKEKSMIEQGKKSILKKVKDKLIYIIEFILSAILMVFLYKFICIKAYEGYYSIMYLAISIITGIATLGTIIYTFAKNKDKIEKIFLSIAIPIGMAYLIFLIPTYGIDESAHIYRSYETSKGILVTQVNKENYIRSNVPVFFLENNYKTLDKYSKLNNLMKTKTDYNNEEEVKSPAYSYPPTLYFPNTIIFLIGRMFSINGIIVAYLARIVNFIVFLVLGYYTIKIIPFGKILIMTYMLIPMAIHQSVTLSADCITHAISFLFVAYTLHLHFKEELTKKNKILYSVLAILVSIHKIAYFPIVLISLIFITSKKVDEDKRIKLVDAVIIIGLIAGVTWIGICSRGTKDVGLYELNYPINWSEQLIYILGHLIKYVKTILTTIGENGSKYYLTFMGQSLGWLNIPVERILLDIYFIILLISPFVEKHDKQLDLKARIIFFLTFIIAMLSIFTALYIGNTGIGLDRIRGVLGRYFIPIVILALIPLCGKEKYIKIKNKKYTDNLSNFDNDNKFSSSRICNTVFYIKNKEFKERKNESFNYYTSIQ